MRNFLRLQSCIRPQRFVRCCLSSTAALTDDFGRFHNYLRISITERCNLRCVYCMPEHGVDLSEKVLTLDEYKRLIGIFSDLGVNKLRFTGGEPTINKQLEELISYSHSINTMKSIGITTNGLVLTSQLDKLVNAGLTHVNISLDTLVPEKFATITRRDSKTINKVLAAIYASIGKVEEFNHSTDKNNGKGLGLRSVKVNCVLMRGLNDDELPSFIRLSQDLPVDIRFIELMPFQGNQWEKEKMVTYIEAIDKLKQQGITLQKDTTSPIDKHDTTKWYRVAGHKGRIGFITSMSNHFCSGCNRLRITADGKLKVCLFGEESLSLIDKLRSNDNNDEIVQHISAAVKRKKSALGGHTLADSLDAKSNRPMILIGG